MERLKAKEKETEKLQKKFKHLLQDWDSIKQSNPRRTLRRCSTDTYSIVNKLNLLENSPRNLMSSLQHRRSPSDGEWQVWNNDLAGEETRRERRAAIESGKVKGRRLFEVSLEGETAVGFGGREEMCIGWSELGQESEVRSVFSYASDDESGNGGNKEEAYSTVCCHCCSCSSSSLVFGENVEREKVVVEAEKVVACGEEKRGVGGNGKRGMLLMAWLAIVLVVFAIGIISVRSFDGYGDENEVILVPT
ncbi:hypothetical protein L1049_027929 [Liquidambar formosana]|uniref:Uncharacterized protein n=1 Tax=Liquidambar formosana TaxID=63359 RepID=A0AAP0WVR2_LIQFO